MTFVPLTALDEKILACEPGGYPWDEWQTLALAAGLGAELAALGRAVMREAYSHGWPERLQRECGWGDEGAAMLERVLKAPEPMRKRWDWLLETDGGSLPEDLLA